MRRIKRPLAWLLVLIIAFSVLEASLLSVSALFGRGGALSTLATGSDGTVIQKLTVQWITQGAGTEKLELKPDSGKVEDQIFQIDFTMSGQVSYAPGEIELEIPAYLWFDRDGTEPGSLELSIPMEPDTGADFAWSRVGDRIIIRNTKTITAASSVLIQGTFKDVPSYAMKDGTESLDFNAKLTVHAADGSDLTQLSNTIHASIDTYVELAATTKTAYDGVNKKYTAWWDGIPEDLPWQLYDTGFLPGNKNTDYVYVRWYVGASAKGSQPFTMTVTDTVESKYNGIMLGISDCAEGIVPSIDGKTVTATLFEGYDETTKTAYIWTAYPKHDLPADEDIEFTNNQTTTVVGMDDHVETKLTADADLPTRTPKTYTFIKHWDDEDDARGYRPGELGIRIYDEYFSQAIPWLELNLTEANQCEDDPNSWIITWTDEGQDRKFKVDEVMKDYQGFVDPDLFDKEGRNLIWTYVMTNWTISDETNTFEYTNSLQLNWDGLPSSIVTKSVEAKYDDNRRESTENFSLNKLKHGESVEVKYTVVATLSGAALAAEKLLTPNNFVLEDTEYTLQGRKLTVADIDIAAVRLFNPTGERYVRQPGALEGESVYKIEAEVPALKLYGMKDGEWLLMARQENGRTIPEPGASISDGIVRLPTGVTRVKVVAEGSDLTAVGMNYSVYLRLYPTDTIKKMIEDAFAQDEWIMLELLNKAEGYVEYAGESPKYVEEQGRYYQTGDRLVEIQADKMGYLHGRDYKVAADLQKEFTFVKNDTSARRIVLHALITLRQQSNVTDGDEYRVAVDSGDIPNTRSGVFYDLLPPGVDPDVNTIVLTAGDSIVDFWTVPNYQNSGRTLLAVRVAMADHAEYAEETVFSQTDPRYPTEGYYNFHTLEFDAYLSWDQNLPENSGDLFNVSAYEADEAHIGSLDGWEGEPDDPKGGNNMTSGTAVGSASDLMAGLDGERDDPAFVYAGARLYMDPIVVYATSGLYKSVQAVGSGYWSDGSENDVNVQEGGDYIYRLSYLSTGSDNTVDSGIILLDSIETYDPGNGDVQWYGTLRSIDVSPIEALGAAPVVYYSTKKGLDLSSYGTQYDSAAYVLENGIDGWAQWPPEDVSLVTAIAIDVRLDGDGEEFVLQNGQVLTAYLHMRAPYDLQTDAPAYFKGTDGKDPLQNGHAYNMPYLDCIHVTPNNGSSRGYISGNHTQVGIYTKDLKVTKVWDDADDIDGKRPGEIKVTLLADGVELKSVTLSDANNWTAVFARLLTYGEDGERIVYTYQEEFETIGDYTLTVSRGVVGDQDIITLTNRHERELIDIPVTKIWNDADNVMGLRPGSVTVRLFADGVEVTGAAMQLIAGDDGTWYGVFTGLPKYRDGGKLIQYTVKEDPVDDYIFDVEYATDEEGNEDPAAGVILTNTYHPYGNLTVEKLFDEQPTEKAAEAEFTFNLLLFLEGEGGELLDVIDKYPYAIYAGDGTLLSEGKIGNGDSFVLKGGQRFVMPDLPTHILYAVSEADKPGFTLVRVRGESGEIISYGDAKATFTNHYASQGVVQLEAWKTLVGRDMARNQFRFELKDGDGNLIMVAYSDQAGNGEKSKVSFGRFYFTDADDGKTFYYQISEVDSGKKGYGYDAHIYKVAITPEDNGDGTMTVKVVYEDGETPEFVNTYTARGNLPIQAWKALAGRSLQDGEFTFGLYDDPAMTTPIQTVRNDADGNVVFTDIQFTEKDVGKSYTFHVKEIAGGDRTVEYDGTVYIYTGTVHDDGDGTLSFSQHISSIAPCEACGGSGRTQEASGETNCAVCEGSGKITGSDAVPVFLNKLKPGSLTLTKRIQGTSPDPTQVFTFRLKLTGKDVPDVLEIEYGAAGNANSVPRRAASVSALADDGIEVTGILGEPGSTVVWELYTDGTLVIRPADGDTGSFAMSGSPVGSSWPWNAYRDTIKKVETKGIVTAAGNLNNMFTSCPRLQSVDMSGFSTSGVAGMTYLFSGCEDLEYVNLGDDFDTSGISSNGLQGFFGYYMFGSIDMGVDKNLSKVYLGTKFFNSTASFELPKPPNDETYTGLWVLADTIGGDEVTAEYNRVKHEEGVNLPGWWVWQTRKQEITFTFEGVEDATPPSDLTFVEGKENTVILVYGDTLTVPTYTKPGYALLYWRDPVSGYILQPGDVIPNATVKYFPGEKVTLIAEWEEAKGYTIRFDRNGGAGSMEELMAPADEPYQLPLCGFVNYGYDFDGWLDQNGRRYENGGIIEAGTYQEGEEVVLTAQWKKRETVITPDEDGFFEITIRGGGMATIKNLPAGTIYQIWEETPDGWILVNATGDSGTILPDDVVAAVFTNQPNPGSASVTLKAEKLLDNKPADADAEGTAFTFRLLGLQPGSSELSLLQTVKAVNGSVQFDQLVYELEDFADLAPGDSTTLTYLIDEVAGENPDILYDPVLYRVTVTITKSEDGNSLGSTVKYETNDGREQSIVTFRNRTLYDLEISKTVAGNMGKWDEAFEFNITLTAEDGYVLPETVSYEKNGEEGELRLADTNGVVTVWLKHGESFRLIGLPCYTAYRIEETENLYDTSIDTSGREDPENNTNETGKNTVGKVDGDVTVAYTNALRMGVPTNATLEYRWLIPLALISMLGVGVPLSNRRKRRQE